METALAAGDPPRRRGESRRRGRWRSGSQTRQRILDVARGHFAREGYDRATVRAIAAEGEADPAMVYYFFGSKQGLFAAAMALPGSPRESLAALLAGGLDHLGPRLVGRFLHVWDTAETIEPLFLLSRSAGTDEESAAMLRDFLHREVGDQLVRAIGTPDAPLRVALVVTHLMGLALARYLVRLEPIASASHDTLVAWLGPMLQQCLTGAAPTAAAGQHRRQPTPDRSGEGPARSGSRA
jgi:AcrR family transcriptional regulator